eukprot:XP_017946378.1 PREDICTED: vomeronasal type-2 receptor 26-like [Xenopus tropicalis]
MYNRFLARGYTDTQLNQQLQKALLCTQDELLHKKKIDGTQTTPLIFTTTYGSTSRALSRSVQRNWPMINQDETLSLHLSDKPMLGYKRKSSLRDLLVKTDFKGPPKTQTDWLSTHKKLGCYKCPDCTTCRCLLTGPDFPHPLTGKTITTLRERIGNHRSAVHGHRLPTSPIERRKQGSGTTAKRIKVDPQIPISQCSDSCLPGYRKMPIPGGQSCCYNCVPCSEGEISNITDSVSCTQCPDMEWPNEMKDQCIQREEVFLSYTNDVISICFSAVSILFFLITQFILQVFIKHRDTPIVRANNRSLSFLLLVSIKLSFLSVFLFLGRPVDITCMLRIITFGITFSIAVSSLLAKTIMVCVAFKATKPGSSWRKWLGVKLSNSVVLFCSSIQIIICMTWLAISPPFQELDIHTSPGTIIIQCNEGSAIGFYSVIGYMGLLAAVSFVLAFLARSLPDSFNEAKYITFSMLLFCSVWITMIPAYLSTKGKNTVCVEIFAILTSSAGLLASIFLPKCYTILLRPEMNTKNNLLGDK